MTDRSATDRAPRPARRAWTVVVATFSARHRWPVLILWFVFTGGLFGLSQAMGGTAAQNAVLNNDRVPSESRVANSTWNAANVRPGDATQVMWTPGFNDPHDLKCDCLVEDRILSLEDAKAIKGIKPINPFV